MIHLYSWHTPNGRKVSIALEELELPYRVHPIDIGRDEQHREAFLAISPNGKIPAIVDDEARGRSLMESGAILLYLAEKAGELLPKEESRRWQAIEWLMWQVGGVGPMLGQHLHFAHYQPAASVYARERFASEVERLYRVLARRLAHHEYLADDYSVADIAVWPWIARYPWQGIGLAGHPNVRRWYRSIALRPAVQRGWRVPENQQPLPLPEPG